MSEGSSTDAAHPSPANQVSLPRWAELKHAYLARHFTEHSADTTHAERATEPDPSESEH